MRILLKKKGPNTPITASSFFTKHLNAALRSRPTPHLESLRKESDAPSSTGTLPSGGSGQDPNAAIYTFPPPKNVAVRHNGQKGSKKASLALQKLAGTITNTLDPGWCFSNN